MRRQDKNKYICSDSLRMIDAMGLIDKNSAGLVYVINDGGRLIGCLTDGDIRRYILRKGTLNATAKDAMSTEPKYITVSEINSAKTIMEKEHVISLAIVDENMVLQDVIFQESYIKLKLGEERFDNALSGYSAIVMAGGKGTRLYPYTKILPKPLIPIGDVPILERILERLASYGIEDIYLTVNYKKEMIKSYFSETVHPYRIYYINEDKPMGTAGSIALIEESFDRPIIITNCDILIEADYEKIMNYHLSSRNELTVISSFKKTIIPYGVLYTGENGIINRMEEKPQLSHLINTGMYIINPEFLHWIPKDKVFHMTQLAELMIAKGRRVGMYPISENAFLDMGEFEELKKMEERLKG